VALTPYTKRRQQDSARVTLKDRNAAGPRADGGAGGEVVDSGGTVPIGVILPYNGAFADIPSNWALCDGTNGTPDLRAVFILGTATEGDVGDTGGSDTHTHNAGTLAVAAHSTGSAQGAGSQPVVTSAGHSVSGATEATTTLPPWFKLAFIRRMS